VIADNLSIILPITLRQAQGDSISFVMLSLSKHGVHKLLSLLPFQSSNFIHKFLLAFFHNYYVYIVACNDGFYYTGVTNDLENRLQQHNQGVNPNCFTYKRLPVVLKYYEHFTDINQAILREKQFKGWGRKKKEALFKEDWDTIKLLARSK
jgi:putative endonuclease